MKKSAVKALALVLLVSVLLLVMTGCNRQILDITYSFSYARICTPDGQIFVEGKVSSW